MMVPGRLRVQVGSVGRPLWCRFDPFTTPPGNVCYLRTPAIAGPSSDDENPPKNKLAIVLPIDAIFATPLQDRPRRSVRDPQIPIGRALQSPSSPRFPPWEAFGRRPGASPSPSQWAGVQNPSPSATYLAARSGLLRQAVGNCFGPQLRARLAAEVQVGT
jgi:hypothetical protein